MKDIFTGLGDILETRVSRRIRHIDDFFAASHQTSQPLVQTEPNPSYGIGIQTIGGHEDRKVLDFVEKRDEIISLVEVTIAAEGNKAGVSIQEVRMGEPAIPPELLVATLREQLATQLNETYRKERAAQKERISVERERATADQQHTLVTAEIQKQAALHRKEQLKLEGEGERLKLTEIAKGQKAQADVLGKDRAMQLQPIATFSTDRSVGTQSASKPITE